MVLVKEHNTKYFMAYPVDTGRKLNVHKTFRRRPGREGRLRGKGRIFNIIRDVDGHIRAAVIEVCQRNLVKVLRLKRSLKHFVPFEIMYVNKHETEYSDVVAGISPIETIHPRGIR